MIRELNVLSPPESTTRKPPWLKVRIPVGGTFQKVKKHIMDNTLNTVCAEARCPNIGECWGAGTATFMLLGDICTRSCSFCAVKTGKPNKNLDWDEPRRITEAAKRMELKHVVLTSINRDDRYDGGAPIFAACHSMLRTYIKNVTIESLIPDFRGIKDALNIIIHTPPDVLSHNLETIPKLYSIIRPQADYQRSLEVLKHSIKAGLRTKTGIMVGVGEKPQDVISLMQDCADIGIHVLTIGQYMQPTRIHHPVIEWVHPDQFQWYKEKGEALGIEHVESGPLVRSSYHAEKHVHTSKK